MPQTNTEDPKEHENTYHTHHTHPKEKSLNLETDALEGVLKKHPAVKQQEKEDAKGDAAKVLKKMNIIIWPIVIIVWVSFFVWLQLLPGMVKQAQENNQYVTNPGCLSIVVKNQVVVNCSGGAGGGTIPQYNGIWVQIGKVLSPYGGQLQIIEYVLLVVVVVMAVVFIAKRFGGKGKKEEEEKEEAEKPRPPKGGTAAPSFSTPKDVAGS